MLTRRIPPDFRGGVLCEGLMSRRQARLDHAFELLLKILEKAWRDGRAVAANMKRYFKKNQNAPRPSEHPPVMGGKMSKRLGGIKGCKYKTSSWHLNGFPDGNNVGEKPIVILYIYINRHAGTPEKH